MTSILRNILEWIYSFVNNYGVAVVLFTVLVRLILTPLEVKSRKGMRKMTEIQPKLNALQEKYGKDQQKLQQKQSELMKKEHYNPLSGCLPLLIQWPILFCMFYAMRDVANAKLIEQAFAFLQGETPVYESFLWVKNVFMPDSPFKTIAVDAGSLIGASAKAWENVFATLNESQIALMVEHIKAAVPAAAELTATEIFDFSSNSALQTVINTYIMPTMQQMPEYIAQTAAVPGWQGVSFLLFSVTIYKNFNGLLILPILSGATQMLMTKMNPATQQPADAKQQGGGMNAFMKYFFPIFSVVICLTSNAGFALYWVAINLFATAQTLLINQYLDKKAAETARLSAGEGNVK